MMLGTLVKSVSSLQPGYSLRALNSKRRLVQQMLIHRHDLGRFMQRMQAALGPDCWQRLGMDGIGVVQWPYISRGWAARRRLEAVAAHFEVVAGQFPYLLVEGRDQSIVLYDLSAHSAGCSLVLDRPVWFKREGELVLNLFQGDLRVASLAFTLSRSEGPLVMFVGAVQGIHKGIDSDTSLAIYRDLTKDFEGLRPRSLLLEALKCLARCLGVAEINAVSDAYRHHRHAYFGHDEGKPLAADYDVIWQESGGMASHREGFFAIPLLAAQRAEADIPAKKRAMYRRRQALLLEVFAGLQAALAGAGGNHELQGRQGDACVERVSAVGRPPVIDSQEQG
ncbi:DUF535 family protein [Pseudomonas sp. S32]|uniref:DUF535 family protein n=1 Tax=Pseudomonas sp. S32 TaxID=2767448 RepID=UPI001914B3E7|nr:DUF535 family protein [Pseudomonas sp. S32]MBK5006448.1 DUF535 domain-containing protein [Pseudomonas sp. S32]